MQKGRGVALPRDIDPRANIDPFHPNTPSSHQVNPSPSPPPSPPLVVRLAALFTQLFPSLSLSHLRESRIFLSPLPSPSSMRLPVSPKGVADLFDNIVISLNRWEGGRGFVGIAIYRFVLEIVRRMMEFWNLIDRKFVKRVDF